LAEKVPLVREILAKKHRGTFLGYTLNTVPTAKMRFGERDFSHHWTFHLELSL